MLECGVNEGNGVGWCGNVVKGKNKSSRGIRA